MIVLFPDPAGGSGCASGFDFNSSRWATVFNAPAHSAAETAAAWSHLGRDYWFPLYAYLRGSGRAKAEAEATLPVFFAAVTAQTFPQPAPPQANRLRPFLLAALKSFLRQPASPPASAPSQFVAPDWAEADRQFQATAAALPPDQAFEYEWKRALLARTIARLRAEAEAAGRGKLFAQLMTTLTASQDSSTFAAVARSLDWEEGAVRVAVLRLRKQYRALLREEVAHTVGEAALVDIELQLLFGAQVLEPA